MAWRSRPAPGRGMTRAAAIARAEQNLVSITDTILAGLDGQLASIGSVLSPGADALDGKEIYEAAHQIASVAAVVGLKDLGEVALGVCDYFEGAPRDPVFARFVIEVHHKCMLRLRRAPPADHEAVGGLKEIRRRAVGHPVREADQAAFVRFIIASTSSARGKAFELQAEAVAEAAASRNAVRGVASMLLAYDGWYLQVAEGEAAGAADLLAALLFDARHNALKIISLSRHQVRRFEGVPMWMTHLGELRSLLDGGMRRDFTPQSLDPQAAWRLIDGIARVKGR